MAADRPLSPAWRTGRFIENQTALLSLILLALFPTLEVIARKFFQTGITNSTEYTRQLVLVLAFLGGAITSREGKHLALSIEMRLPESVKTRLQILNAFLTLTMTTAFSLSALSFSLNAFDHAQKIGPFPVWIISLVMPVGYFFMAIRALIHLPRGKNLRWVTSWGTLFGLILAFSSLVNAIRIFGPVPGFLESIGELSVKFNTFLAVPLIFVLIASAVAGVPLFIVLGGVAYMLFARTGQPLEVVPNEAYSLLLGHALPAIPLFAFVGFILAESKAGERLVRLFRALFAWFPGGLAIMAILICAFFTTFTGASGITILALGPLLSFILVKGKYGVKFSNGLLTATGSIGLLFIPSLPVIIYGVTAQVNIMHMFAGGFLPGFLMVLTVIIYGMIYAKKTKVPKEDFNLKEAFRGLKGAVLEILLPIVVVVSYFGGIATLVECGAIAVIYALIIEVIIHRDIKINHLPRVMLKCMPVIGGVLMILALAKGLSYYIVDANIPVLLTEWTQSAISSKFVFLLLVILLLVITGCLMDIFSAIMVVAPLIIPLGDLFGMHPVHMGIIFLATMELGYLTPPVGLNLFLASYSFNQPMSKITRQVLPFLLIRLITVLLITFIPFFSTALLKFF